MLYNPFSRLFYLHCLENSALHGKLLDIPKQFTPYRRLLAVRACKCGLLNYDNALLSLPNVQVPQDVASLDNASSTTSSALQRNSSSSAHQRNSSDRNSYDKGLKRKVVDIHASDEERRRQRKEKFPTAEPRQFENEEHRKKGMGVLPQSKDSWEPTFKLFKQK